MAPTSAPWGAGALPPSPACRVPAGSVVPAFYLLFQTDTVKAAAAASQRQGRQQTPRLRHGLRHPNPETGPHPQVPPAPPAPWKPQPGPGRHRGRALTAAAPTKAGPEGGV